MSDDQSYPPRFRDRAAVDAYNAQMRWMAETPTERRIVALASSWAIWHQRRSARPTPANDRREELAWTRLQAALVEADLVDTWLDPSD